MAQEFQQQTWFDGVSPESATVWERKLINSTSQSSKVHSYRGIPDQLDQKVKTIAQDLKVPVGEVVRVLLEYALSAYELGELMLNPQPRIVHAERNKTLFPDS